MASDLRGYTEQETLNKVLNTDNDSIQVDIVDATGVSITTTNESVYADDADWTDTTSKHTLVGGLYQSSPQTITNGDTGPLQVNSAGNLIIDVVNGGVLEGLVDGIETLLGTIDSDTDAIKTSLDNIDNSVDGNFLNVNMSLAGSDAQAAEGTITSTTQRVTIATDDDGVAHLATIAGDTTSVDGKITACNTGAVVLAASDGTDIGNVDVASIVPGVAATSLGKAEDAAHSSGDTGVTALVVRNDVLEALTSHDGDYSVLQVNKTGALNVTETVGHLGAHYENTTGTIDSLKIVAFQFLEDTKFSVLTPATSAYIGNTSSGGEDVPNDEVFPQGMTIFGRWTAFTLVSGGRVIAYLGDW